MKKNDHQGMRRIQIFDTTLRDGEQSPGASMGVEDKLAIARHLAKMKVDTIEAGFPVSSPVQFDAVKLIARKVKGPIITGLCRSVRKDIDSCYNATKYSSRPGIHTFLATSDIHLKYKLKIDRSRCLELAVEAVKYARSKLDYVQFSAEDASRTDPAFLIEVVRQVIRAGASVVNLPDTVGYAVPTEYRKMVEHVLANVPEAADAVISVHCHNDLGLATANSLAAVEAGARQVEGAINGIGERAGNASLEEIVMGLYTRSRHFNAYCGVRTAELYSVSKLVTSVTGIRVQPNKAIVGENAFAHEAGIHQDGVIKNPQTYEIMDPRTIGIPSNKLVLGRHSGKHGFQKRLEELGVRLAEKDFDQVFERFLALADKKKQVYDDDVFALLAEVKSFEGAKNSYELSYFHVMSGTSIVPNATVRLTRDGKEFLESSWGDGPVDAVFKAVEKITGTSVKLIDYRINALGSGKEAQGEVILIVEHAKNRYTGHGSSTDIVEASAKAFLSAINKIILLRQ
jgi:2-isopropylmalate synthase